MIRPGGPASRPPSTLAALEAVDVLDGWLREQRAALASETLLSRPSVRRIEGAFGDLEDLLEEVRVPLLVLAFESAQSPSACRGVVVDRCREILATWRAGMEKAEARSADRERDLFARFLPRLADSTEAIVEAIFPRRKGEAGEEKRAEEKRQLLARADLPVM